MITCQKYHGEPRRFSDSEASILDVWSSLSVEEGLSLLGPDEVEDLGLPLLPLVDPPQAQDVEHDGQEHHQDADGEEVVVVNEGGAQPAGVVLA